MKEAKDLVVETCGKVIEHYAAENGIEKEKVNIRIDLQSIKAKPIFGIFNASNLVNRQTLSEVIKATGGASFSMILNTYVKKVIRDIFTQSLKQLELTDPKRIFVLLYEKRIQGVSFPFIALYKDREFMFQMKVADIINTENHV